MEDESINNLGPDKFFIFSVGFLLGILFLAWVKWDTQEKAIENYILHPENYELRYTYVKGDSTPVDLIVIKKEK